MIYTSTIGLWLFFIVFAELKNKVYREDMEWYKKYPLLAFGVLFLIGDVFYNITMGSILFLDPPRKDRLTLTARLRGYLKEPDSWRRKIALFMCKYMIPWDYNHCGLA